MAAPEQSRSTDPETTLASCADPYLCGRCLAAGDECQYHQGFGAGWDACAAFMADIVEPDRWLTSDGQESQLLIESDGQLDPPSATRAEVGT